MLDTTTPFGQKVARRLQTEEVIWLITVAEDGTPQPNPVWFLWESDTILIYTQPGSKKIRNLRRRPRVSLHFDATQTGEDVVVFTGSAELVDVTEETQKVQYNSAYVEKYRKGLANLDSSPEKMGAEYTTMIRVRPDKVRGW